MSLTRKIAHNTIYQVTGKAIGTVIGIVVISLLTSYLGAEGFGQYTTILAFVQLFSIISDFGLYVVMIRKISEPGVDSEKIISNIFTLRLISGVILLGLAPIVSLFFPYPWAIKVGILIASFSFLFVTLNQLLYGVFQQKLHTEKTAIAEVAGKILLLLATITVITLNLGILSVIWTIVIGNFTIFFVSFLFLRRIYRIRLTYNKEIWKNVLKLAFPIAISISLNLIYFKADTIILSLYHSQTDVGIYGAPYKILEVLITFPALFVGLVLPILSKSYLSQKMDEFKQFFQKAWDFLLIVSVPLIFGTLPLADGVMRFIIRQRFEEFTESPNLLRILMIAVASIFCGTLLGYLVVTINKQKQMVWGYLAVAVTSLVGYLIFIPRFSYYGAAWMTVYSELAILVIAFTLVVRTTKVYPSLKTFFKVLVAAGVMCGVLYLMVDLNIFVSIITGGLVYFIVLYILGGIKKETILEIIRLKK